MNLPSSVWQVIIIPILSLARPPPPTPPPLLSTSSFTTMFVTYQHFTLHYVGSVYHIQILEYQHLHQLPQKCQVLVMVPCKMMSATFETSFQTVTPITSLSAWRHARTQQIGSRLWPHRCLSAEIIHDWGRWLRSRPRRRGNGVCRIWILLLRCEWINGCKWVRERVCMHVCVCVCVCVCV